MNFGAHIARMDRTVNRTFGESVPVVYAPAVGAPVSTAPGGQPLIGIFDRNHVLIPEGRSGVDSVGPAVSFMLADLPVDPEDDKPLLTIAGRTYRPHATGDRDSSRILLLLHEVG